MNDWINKWYKNHALLYKVLLFLSTTFLIVYLFPKSGKFRYDFDKGKPWQSENLYAPFDFAIKKSADEIESEQREASEKSPVYFDLDVSVKPAVLAAYDKQFNSTFSDSSDVTNSDLYKIGESIINDLYSNGVLDEAYQYSADKTVILLSEQRQYGETQFSNLSALDAFKIKLASGLNERGLETYNTIMTSVFFDVIKPSLKRNLDFTQNALTERLNNISTVRGSIEKATLIISKGEIVEGNKYDILRSLEAEYKSQVWNESNYNLIVFAYALLVALALLMLLLFLRKYRIEVFLDNTKVTFIFFNVLLMILLTTLVINYNSQYVYVVPLCILPLVLKAFFDARLGLFAHVLTVLLLGFIVPNSYEYMFLQIIAGIVTILTVSELYKRANLFISVGQITLIYIVAYFAFFVIQEGDISNLDPRTFGLFILCGLATLFVQPLIYIYEKLFGLVSDVSLLELSDTNTKLLKELSNKAPGTFHHSLNVANLAEASANEIGANAMLIRVGALYHDIGKMKNPTYFTENQATGINPHDELSSYESAQIIIDHVLDGIEIAKKNNLPDRVIDFIRTHHGTSMVYYFYRKEKDLDANVKEEDFRYPGPKPFSKETAILMMCDSVEAASRSLKEPNTAKIDKFVESIINKQMEDGQFLNANITFKEIQSIKKILKYKLANIFHLRIEYPE
ncbi:HDIG domain-containing metalloprotein [Psychroserpens sp.]|uniref:HD family phosphohydrolase n=1 Tax=Psychroserpens sp. TaxID=2020870 RepID=UPI001B234A33|nr:HDIG domain-containing metalloprotein [Psychroserpens sp.]MBO6607100.1 HDIG domain-containing protein [Psychroserpens sp.]MBO6654246.1 HDIG domain-containing protein [Psychroserpens sp.]MBO6682468.1 HDIG domain-containing protein [Psychroserpens sp.]MBO6750872.1 HDIG domain-containing protein [Psychroserpens sp.]MBO6915699.1 HDIG domain-containing protein [Psychroserpens sp.]